MLVKDLKVELRERGLSMICNKAALIDRLLCVFRTQAESNEGLPALDDHDIVPRSITHPVPTREEALQLSQH